MSLKLMNLNESGIKSNVSQVGDYKMEAPFKGTDLLTGKTIITHSTTASNFKVVAHPSYMTIKGEINLHVQKDLEAFAQLIAEMWAHHSKLKNAQRSEILNA